MHWQALLRPSTLITDRLFDFVQTNTAIACTIEEHVSEIFTVDMFQHRSNRQKWNVLESIIHSDVTLHPSLTIKQVQSHRKSFV